MYILLLSVKIVVNSGIVLFIFQKRNVELREFTSVWVSKRKFFKIQWQPLSCCKLISTDFVQIMSTNHNLKCRKLVMKSTQSRVHSVHKSFDFIVSIHKTHQMQNMYLVDSFIDHLHVFEVSRKIGYCQILSYQVVKIKNAQWILSRILQWSR